MTKRKLYQCTFEGCLTVQPILSKKLCQYHYNLKKPTKATSYNLKQTAKNRRKKSERGALLKVYYEYHLNVLQTRQHFCENCGCQLQGNICNVAHVLPKRNAAHPEVMDELTNIMYLCSSLEGHGCHEKYDRIQTTSKVYLMPCFQVACERYSTFRDKITRHSKFVEIFENWLDKEPKEFIIE